MAPRDDEPTPEPQGCADRLKGVSVFLLVFVMALVAVIVKGLWMMLCCGCLRRKTRRQRAAAEADPGTGAPHLITDAVEVEAELGAELRAKYARTARWYDLLDYPWERLYRQWRPMLAGDLGADGGVVLDLGVGTGRNLRWFPPAARVTGVDLSPAMIHAAQERVESEGTRCTVERLVEANATDMREHLADGSVDAVLATFIFCVMPDELQGRALREISRVLKPGGRFRLLEMVFAPSRCRRGVQWFYSHFVEWMYGARFDRHTLETLQRDVPDLVVTSTKLMGPAATYLLIEGHKGGAGDRDPAGRGAPVAEAASESPRATVR